MEYLRLIAVAGVCFGLAVVYGCAQPETYGHLEATGPYFGQEPALGEPALFAPGIVSTDTAEWSMAFSPDGREVFFGIMFDDQSRILHSKETESGWTEPVVAHFSGVYSDFDLTMSNDGNRLYFTSMRPESGVGEALEHPDIWYVDRTEDGWGDPIRFPAPINTQMRELYPSESSDGFIYFFSERPQGFGRTDVYRFAKMNGDFGEPEILPETINTEVGEGDSCISPEGDYLIFTSTRDEGFGRGDLYVSFRIDDGGWTQAVNLGETVNTEHLEFCPSVSRDGKYLFFTSDRPSAVELQNETKVRVELGATPREGRADLDIYWVDASFIQDLRVPTD